MQSIRGPDENIGGAIAQLGERLLCTQEVGGSIPPGSTTTTFGIANSLRTEVFLNRVGITRSVADDKDFHESCRTNVTRFNAL